MRVQTVNTVIREGTDGQYWRPLTVSLDLSILQKMGCLHCIVVQQRCATHKALSSCNHSELSQPISVRDPEEE